MCISLVHNPQINFLSLFSQVELGHFTTKMNGFKVSYVGNSYSFMLLHLKFGPWSEDVHVI